MNQTTYPVDYASILFLSLMRSTHTNSYRFTVTMDEPVSPEILQQAVNGVYRRFPTIIAGFKPGFFQYRQVPAVKAPQVQPVSALVPTMTAREIRECPFRVLYEGCDISIEAFHALADGYGAIACISTLVAEYLRLKYGERIPATGPVRNIQDSPSREETDDAYPAHMQGPPVHLPSRYAYQLPGPAPTRDGIRSESYTADTETILQTARSYGVSVTALISTVMAISVMEIQQQHEGKCNAPARIMVPIDLRRQFSSRTLRNFILYALPTLEPDDTEKPFAVLVRDFAAQIKELSSPTLLASIMAYNVKTQASPLFRAIPLAVKSFAMRTAYRYFGESNSSITVTNLGNVTLPEEMARHVSDFRVYLTPRTRSPYNCGIISYGDKLHIIISRFAPEPELETVFVRNMDRILQEGRL